MNNFSFTGNTGRDADQKFMGDSTSLVSFAVAVKSGFGDNAATTWVNCKFWGKRSEGVFPYLKKGQLVGVNGELTLREYDKKDGSGKGSSLEVRVNDLTLLGKKGDTQPSDAVDEHNEAKSNAYQKPANTFDDDVGF